jgi:hypothetical protein
MSPRAFRDLCTAHHERAVERGDAVQVFSPGEQFAFDMYRTLRDDPKSPLRTVLTTVINPHAVDDGLLCVRSKLTALEIAGTCNRDLMDDWRQLEAVLVTLHELCTGAPETGDEEEQALCLTRTKTKTKNQH